MTDTVLIGTVLRKSPLTDRQNINKAWKAQVRTEAGDLSAIVKTIPEREILIECLCSVLGQFMGLPIPRPMIVSDSQEGVLFGSEEQPHPDLKRCQISQVLVAEMLINWDMLPTACVFDEWIANPDRHGGNILTNGAGEFWLIDHGLALAENLEPEQKLKNYLLNLAAELADNDLKKQRLLNAFARNLPIKNLNWQTLISFFSDQSVIKFLQDRSPLLFTLLRKTVLNHDEIPGF